MTGISEILVLLLLIVSILILPRLFKGEPDKKASASRKLKKLSAKIRLGILLSLAYPVAMALYLKPWTAHQMIYLSCGVLPVLLAWGIVWILAGTKK